MADDGIERALAFFTSAYSSYSGCRQYRENIVRAQMEVGSRAPQVDKLRVFYNHPGFVGPMLEQTQTALDKLEAADRPRARVLYTAHSIPLAMADNCRYVDQLEEVARMLSEQLRVASSRLVYQSRSGPPTQPWLEPDVCDAIRELAEGSRDPIVIVPIGFISDHLEVLYDLDREARQLCDELQVPMVRAGTVGTHPRFVRMICELIDERRYGGERLTVGNDGPSHDVCPEDCCLPGKSERVKG